MRPWGRRPASEKDNSLQNIDAAAPSGAARLDARRLTQTLAQYGKPSNRRGLVEIAITLVPLVALWLLAWTALDLGYWVALLLAVPAAGFLVRLFMIQHDCGHGSFFRHRARQRLGRPRHRRADADALRLLAPHPCHPPRHLRQSRPARHRRHRHADGARISGAVAVGPAALSPLPPSAGDVRHRPGLSVHAAAPAAGRPDARRLAAVAQHHGDQSRDCHGRRRADLADRRQGVPARAPADHAARRRRSASGCSTCSTSSRNDLGRDGASGTGHEAALHGSSHYDLPARAALVHRQYRHAPRPPPVQPHSLLPPAPGAARPSGAARRRPPDAVAEPPLRAADAVGRAQRRLVSFKARGRPATSASSPSSTPADPASRSARSRCGTACPTCSPRRGWCPAAP